MKMGTLTLVLLTAAMTSFHRASCVETTQELRAIIGDQAEKLTELENTVLMQSKRMLRSDSQLEELSATVTLLKESIGKTQSSKDPKGSFVAFEAQYRSDPHHNIQDNDVMLFDDVKLNVGNGYHNQNGTFVAPVSGVYVFNIKLTPSPSGHIYAYLLANDTKVDSTDATDNDNTVTGTTDKLLQLQRGDSVYVRKDNGVTSVRGWTHTKFSGYLLRETD